MINYKNLTIDDLKKDYKNTHGFVFEGVSKSSDSSVQNLCETLIKTGITSEYPQFVVNLSDTIKVFVYDQDFNCPDIMRVSHKICNATRMCKIVTLTNFLNENT